MAAPHPLTIIARLTSDEGRRTELRQQLFDIGQDVDDNPYIRFINSRSTHFCRFLMIPDNVLIQHQTRLEPHLVFSSNYDGKLDDYLLELQDIFDAEFFEFVWGSCVDYKGVADFSNFVRRNKYDPQAFFVAFRDETVLDTQQKSLIRQQLERRLDDPDFQQEFLRNLRFRNATPGEILGEMLSSFLQPILDATLNPLIGKILDEYIFSLPPASNIDAYSGIRANLPRLNDPDYDETVEYQARYEDKMGQNQMNILSVVKPGHLAPLKRQLWLVNTAAKFMPPGELNGIRTIHFARWLIFNNGKHMLFFSNYDGTWENYISDFVRKVAGGMHSIWKHTVDFPAGGPPDIAAFQQHIREHQIRSLVFYSAYPRLSVNNRVVNRMTQQLINGELRRKDRDDALRVL